MNLVEFISIIDRGGVLVLLVVIIWGGIRGWYVWRWQYKQLEQDRDWWRSTAMRSVQITEAAIDQAPPETALARRMQVLEHKLDNLTNDDR